MGFAWWEQADSSVKTCSAHLRMASILICGSVCHIQPDPVLGYLKYYQVQRVNVKSVVKAAVVCICSIHVLSSFACIQSKVQRVPMDVLLLCVQALHSYSGTFHFSGFQVAWRQPGCIQVVFARNLLPLVQCWQRTRVEAAGVTSPFSMY